MKEITYEEYVECLKAIHDNVKTENGYDEHRADDYMTRYLNSYGNLYRYMIGDYTGSIEHIVINAYGMDLKKILLDSPIESMPLLINTVVGIERAIVLWRLKISK
jgi:hypothetical protein